MEPVDPARASRARFHYEGLATLFQRRFGERDWVWAAGAWASARELGVSPVVALRHAFFYFIGRPHDQFSEEGQALERIMNAWSWGKDGSPFRSAFVSDFLDVLEGKAERSWTGACAGESPIPIDTWGLRQAGFVDDEFRDILQECGGPAPPSPAAAADGSSYALAQRFFIERALEWNEHQFLGVRDWLPHQAEAVGRFELQERLGLEPLTAEEIFEEAELDS